MDFLFLNPSQRFGTSFWKVSFEEEFFPVEILSRDGSIEEFLFFHVSLEYFFVFSRDKEYV